MSSVSPFAEFCDRRCSFMWPLYLLLNKILKPEEGGEVERECINGSLAGENLHLLQSVTYEKLSVDIKCHASARPRSQFIDEQLSSDVARVEKLFREALALGMSIQCRSFGDEEISLLILSGKYIAIALVDQYKLSRTWLEDVCLSSLVSSTAGYTGHYIVICGYDTDKDEFEIRDPAGPRKHEKVSSKCLGEARKSFGTDEDLLLISLDNGRNVVGSSSQQISLPDYIDP